jgi:hypothetical protein
MFANTYNHPRGAVCIARMFRGQNIAFKLEQQHHYLHCTGCFSLL